MQIIHGLGYTVYYFELFSRMYFFIINIICHILKMLFISLIKNLQNKYFDMLFGYFWLPIYELCCDRLICN